MNYKVGTLFFAFAKGQESKEVAVKRYIGVAPVSILSVNPTKSELEKLYSTTIEKAPEYVSTTKVGEDTFPQVRIDFIVKTNASKADGVDLTTKISFFITNTPEYNKDKTKVRVINKYGEDTWLTQEDLKNKTLPSNMTWYNLDGVRACRRGERDLTDFLKAFLVIPNRTYTDRNTGERKQIDDLSSAEAQLGHIEDYFKGDVSELRDIIASQPTNNVKMCFGVKTSDDNKQYQDVFIRKAVRMRVTDYSKLDEDIKSAQSAGSYPNTEFSVEPIHEYKVAATTFTAPTSTSVNPSDFFA